MSKLVRKIEDFPEVEGWNRKTTLSEVGVEYTKRIGSGPCYLHVFFHTESKNLWESYTPVKAFVQVNVNYLCDIDETCGRYQTVEELITRCVERLNHQVLYINKHLSEISQNLSSLAEGEDVQFDIRGNRSEKE